MRANPERLVWGGDWPHPRMETEMPDGGLVRAVPSPDAATRARILVTNPDKFYDFPG